jgi:hypothetical protein
MARGELAGGTEMTRWSIVAAAAALLVFAGVSPGTAALYQEQGDAPDSFDTPQAVNGTFDGIAGDVGACGARECDEADVFLFGWGGGFLGMKINDLCTENCLPVGPTATLFNATPGILFQTNSFEDVRFFSEAGNPVELPAGNYYLRVAAAFDPPYSVLFFTLDDPQGDPLEALITQAIPAPAGFALLGLGLAAVVARRRRGVHAH